MKLTYTGKPEALTPAENRRIEVKFGKLAKLLDAPRGEREAHVIVASQRHLKRAEITVQFHAHPLVGVGTAADAFTAMTDAIEKLEKQILKLLTKWRDTQRTPAQEPEIAPAAEVPVRTSRRGRPVEPEAEPEAESESPQVYRIDHHERRKPMTLEEAMLEIDGRDYVVYRDAETGHVSVLIRRRDGNFDLIKA